MSTLNISWASDSPTVDTVTVKSCGGNTPTMLEIVVRMAPTTWKGPDDTISTGNGDCIHHCASTDVMVLAGGGPYLVWCMVYELLHDLRVHLLRAHTGAC